ncbi:MAG: hypothetical protein ACRDN0_04155 [Trebonia sp.]
MNEYGAMGKKHWQRWLPQRYAGIEDPETYFAALGEEVPAEIAGLWAEMQAKAGNPPGEDFMERVGRLNAMKKQAEEIVLHERVLLPPEPGGEDDG